MVREDITRGDPTEPPRAMDFARLLGGGEGETELLGLLFADRHVLSLGSQSLVPSFDHIVSGRKIPDLERPGVSRHAEIGMVQHSTVSIHPLVDIALEG